MTAQRVLVTGGCGFIGSHLVEALRHRGDDVTVLDVPPVVPAALEEVLAGSRYVCGDLRDAGTVRRVVSEGFDVIYHMAAVVGVDRYLSSPLDVIDTNVIGTRAVLDAASRTDTRVLLASTSEVFGRNEQVPWAEDSDRVLGPTSVARWSYSSSKAVAEHMAFALAGAEKLRMSIVRYFNVYGPRQRPAYTISRAVHRVLNHRAPVVYDSGRQTRSFTYVRDAVEGTMTVADRAEALGQVFNIGSTFETSVADATALVAERTGWQGPVSTVSSAAGGGAYEDIDRRVPDVRRAREVLGFVATTPLVEGVDRTVAWARSHPEWLEAPDSGMT